MKLHKATFKSMLRKGILEYKQTAMFDGQVDGSVEVQDTWSPATLNAHISNALSYKSGCLYQDGDLFVLSFCGDRYKFRVKAGA